MIANIEVKFKNNSEHFKLLIYEKSRTLNRHLLYKTSKMNGHGVLFGQLG